MMWRGFCEHLRECGRNGTLFVYVLGTLFVAVPFGTAGLMALTGLFLAGLGWVWGEVRAQRNRFERLGRMPPLAETDLRAARMRLTQRARR